MKRGEIITVKFKNSPKLLDHFDDPNQIFSHEKLASPEIEMKI
jgi:hypothetical protein